MRVPCYESSNTENTDTNGGHGLVKAIRAVVLREFLP